METQDPFNPSSENIQRDTADRRRAWERFVHERKKGDDVSGVVQRRIDVGFLIDVDGVLVLLRDRETDGFRVHQATVAIGEPVRARITRIDIDHCRVFVSQRRLLRSELQRRQAELFAGMAEGQIRRGTVTRIADFGVFVDLGGIDGLLHISQMAWRRIKHPGEIVQVGQDIEVKVLGVEAERMRISLGLKQLQPSPWDKIEELYPVRSNHRGEVIELRDRGALIELEDGIVGFVHASQMVRDRGRLRSITVGEKVDVVVLGSGPEPEELSLSMKQVKDDRWDSFEQRCPPGTVTEGTVRNCSCYGAIVEFDEGVCGLVHLSEMSWNSQRMVPSEFIEPGRKLRCLVLSIDKQERRIRLSVKQLTRDPWVEDIPSRYHVGDQLTGVVTGTKAYGAFVELEVGLRGLLHISDFPNQEFESPDEIFRPGMKIEVRVIGIDGPERRIKLSFVRADLGET